MNYYSPAYLLKLHDTTHPETTTPFLPGLQECEQQPPLPSPPQKKKLRTNKQTNKFLAFKVYDRIFAIKVQLVSVMSRSICEFVRGHPVLSHGRSRFFYGVMAK